ncbi:MAG: hypothetical protein JOY91_00680, partial [Sinobacteraceae bacterium]|nr:hypothetical protein [Nevskiaceae bacterium]
METSPTGAGSDATGGVADPAIVRARSALLAEMDAELTPTDAELTPTNAVLSATLSVRPLDVPLTDTQVLDHRPLLEAALVDTALLDTPVLDTLVLDTPVPDTRVPDTPVLEARMPITPRPDTARVEISPPLPQARRTSRTRRKARWVSPTSLLALGFTLLLYVGFTFPTERYITPRRGLGYALGIIGGSLMLLLLVYSARKRFRWLRFLGPTVGWFRTHMLLGVLGPLCILYHANFNLGAANSNVALFSMLAVSGSGLIGRYIYAHIHHGLYGSKLTLRELQQNAAKLRSSSDAFVFLPELMSRLEAAEAH